MCVSVWFCLCDMCMFVIMLLLCVCVHFVRICCVCMCFVYGEFYCAYFMCVLCLHVCLKCDGENWPSVCVCSDLSVIC